ncbi:hypothetical protein VPHD148_0106 [Vibrio phage D148]
MGQGAESAGGYEQEYNPWEEGLATGDWTQKNLTNIHVSDMSYGHLKNTIRLCENNHLAANFECDKDLWSGWIGVLTDELSARERTRLRTTAQEKTLTKQRGLTRQMKCHCGKEYSARIADLNRGWARSCSKRCAAIRREFGRPAGTPTIREISL